VAPIYDLLIIGAGPAGSTAARQARLLGLGRVLVVERRAVPRPKTCAGGLSPRALKVLRQLGLHEPVLREAYPVGGFRLVSPGGGELAYRGPEMAAVLPRERLDEILLGEALRAGAELRERTRVASIQLERGRAAGVVLEGGEAIEARWILIAAGANSRFDADPRPRRILASCMAWFEGMRLSPRTLEMVFDPEILPHYGWLFPESDTRANIGICVESSRLGGRSVRDLFARFLERYFGPRIRGAEPVGAWRGHPISTTAWIEHHARPGTLLLGEAARLVSSATGEGISYAIESGLLAARTLLEARGTAASPREVSIAYERALRRGLQASFLAAHLFRRHGTGALDPLVGLGNNPRVRAFARRFAKR
jgi:menaquinone-9 beta-reductase